MCFELFKLFRFYSDPFCLIYSTYLLLIYFKYDVLSFTIFALKIKRSDICNGLNYFNYSSFNFKSLTIISMSLYSIIINYMIIGHCKFSFFYFLNYSINSPSGPYLRDYKIIIYIFKLIRTSFRYYF